MAKKTTTTAPTSSIVGDIVWNDANGNGIQDAGEQGLGGVKIQVLGKDASGAFTVVVAETTTAANGSYGFTGLKSGTAYQLHVVAPAGYTASGANKGSDDTLDSDFNAKTGNTASFKLVDGENHLNLDAGFYMPAPAKTGSIGDRVWNDADGDGIQDKNEAGIGGVTVKLENAAGTVLQTTTTAADGSYHFDKVAAGKYKVEFVAPQDYLFTTQGANGSTTANDSNADAHGLTQQFTLAEGKTNNTIDAGLIYCPPAPPPPAPTPASIGNFVWNDANQNGIQDSGEAGIGGVTVKLEDASGAVLKTTTTAADGSYHFNDLAAGDYKVRFVAPTDYVFTDRAATNSTSANDSNADINGLTQLFKLVAGQSDQTIDAGLIYNPPPPPPKPAALGDFVWNDVNGNGIQDSGEAGIGGVTVKLLNDGVVLKTTTTAADGSYHFDNLLADHYKVQFVAPQDYVFSEPGAAGSTTANDSNADASGLTQDIVLTPGQTDNTIDAGLHLKRGSLGDFVWSDTNGNGVQDSGEAGVSGVTVRLYTAGADGQFGTTDDVLVDNTTTDVNGHYLFTGLQAGQYQVQFTAPSNARFTSEHAGSNAALDSDVDATGSSAPITLTVGQNDLNVDAGLVPRPAPSGFAKGVEDTNLTLSWSQITSSVSGDSIGIASLPANGSLLLNGQPLAVGQVVSKADIDAGHLIFKPTLNESGEPQYLAPGIGNKLNDYAAFDFTIDQGHTPISAPGTFKVDIQPIAENITAAYIPMDQVQSVGSSATGSAMWGTYGGNGLPNLGSYISPNPASTDSPRWFTTWENLPVTIGFPNGKDADGSERTVVELALPSYAGRPTAVIKDAAGHVVVIGHLGETSTLKDAGGTTFTVQGTPDYYQDAAGHVWVNLTALASKGSSLLIPDYTDSYDPKLPMSVHHYQNGYTIGSTIVHEQEVNSAGTVLDEKVVKLGSYLTYPSKAFTPLVLDLNGDGVHTQAADAGVRFDFLGSGTPQAMGWVDKHDGLLALDLNHNGKIDSGAELFGEATRLPDGSVAKNGFQALAQYDSNHDGRIDSHDAIYSQLQVWVDANSDGVTQAGELRTLAQAGVAAINLASTSGTAIDNGNLLGLMSSYTGTDGAQRDLVDVWFATAPAAPEMLSPSDALLHQAFGAREHAQPVHVGPTHDSDGDAARRLAHLVSDHAMHIAA